MLLPREAAFSEIRRSQNWGKMGVPARYGAEDFT